MSKTLLDYQFNSFQEICDVATKEQWCWNIYCWCGHSDFAKSLAWLVRSKVFLVSAMMDKNYRNEIFSNCRTLQDKVKNIDIEYFATNYKSPRFLGYLGLCLHYTKKVEEMNRILTESWTPQLIRIIEKDDWKKYLQKILDDERILTLKDLENIEMCFPRQNYRYRGKK